MISTPGDLFVCRQRKIVSNICDFLHKFQGGYFSTYVRVLQYLAESTVKVNLDIYSEYPTRKCDRHLMKL